MGGPELVSDPGKLGALEKFPKDLGQALRARFHRYFLLSYFLSM